MSTAAGGVLRFGDGEPRISVITVFNRRDVLERCLLPALRAQTGIAFEWVGVDNTRGGYENAADALNEGARLSRGAVLLFVHQDVILYGAVWLSELSEWLRTLPDTGVAGVIGRAGDGRFVGYIQDRNAVLGEPLAAPEIVQTLDECVLVMPRRVHERTPFVPAPGGWHVYGVDACLRVRRSGLQVYALPLFVHHDSSATNLDQLAAAHAWISRRHGSAEPIIHTTCGTIRNDYGSYVRSARSRLMRTLRRISPRFAHRLGRSNVMRHVEARYARIVVVHSAPSLPPAVPGFVQAQALSPGSTARLSVQHLTLQPGSAAADLEQCVHDADLVLLSSADRMDGACHDLIRAGLRNSFATIVASAVGDVRQAEEALRTAGWSVSGKRMASGTLIELKVRQEAS